MTRAERNRYRADGEYCFRCGDKLDPAKSVYLVLSCRTSEFYATEEEADATGCNQGCFPFGSACAKAQLRETAAKVETDAGFDMRHVRIAFGAGGR